jgi:HK97 family phage portal protein
MSFFSSLLGRGDEEKALDASALSWSALLGSPMSKTGLPVNEATALRVAVVWACCRILTEDIGKLPLKLLKEDLETGAKLPDRKHPVARVLKRPNAWQTSMEWRMQMLLHALLDKGGYSYISRGSDGDVLELIPLLPGRVIVHQDPFGRVVYEVRQTTGGSQMLRREDVHAIHGLSWDGLTALPVVRQGAEAIGLAIAAEETQARLHGQGARPGGIVTTPNKLTKEQVDSLKKQFADGYTGVANAFKTLLLDNGLEFKPWTMNGVDSQQLETRRHQVEEICRFFRVFPAMIGYSDKATTYASAESFFGAHVGHSLMPWVTLWEQALERDLLTSDEVDQGYQVQFVVQGLLRGDAKTRSEYYSSGITNGWMTRNEARALEDMNPLPGLNAVLQPLNMGSTGSVPAADDPADQ